MFALILIVRERGQTQPHRKAWLHWGMLSDRASWAVKAWLSLEWPMMDLF